MTPAESVQAALEHLKTLGIEADCQVGDPVQDRQLAELAELAKIVLPADMLDFYRQFGDGYRLLWENEGEQVFGGFMLTPVQDVIDSLRHRMRSAVEFSETRTFKHVRNRKLSVETAHAMRRWFEIISIGNGDGVWIDSDSGCVRFNQHDWFDGGIGTNGAVMAESFSAFVTKWSQRSFLENHNWGDVLRIQGVDWNHAAFLEKYRLTKFLT